MSKDTFTFLFIMIYIPEKRSFIIEMMTMSCTIMGFLIDEVKFQVWHDECAVSSYDSIYIYVQFDSMYNIVCAVTSYDTLYVQWKQFSPRQIQLLPITAATALGSV